jgi:hypothetical protein
MSDGLGADRPGLDALRGRGEPMIRIAISAAYDAISATLPLSSPGYEAETNERGERLVWLAPAVVDRFGTMRGPGETYSDVILRIVGRDG